MGTYPYQQWDFGGPDFNSGYDPEGMASFIRPRRDQLRQQGQNFQKDLINLQTQNRMKEFDQQLKAQTDYEKRQRDEQVTDRNLAASIGGTGSALGQPRTNPLGPSHDLFADKERSEALAANKGRQDLQDQMERERIDIARKNSDTLAAQRAEPHYTFRSVPGGNIVGIETGSGRQIDTGIPSGTMTQEGAITARGDQARQTVDEQGRVTAGNIANRGAQDRETKQTPAAPTATQQIADTNFRARTLRQTYPAWANFITINPDGSFQVKNPGEPGGPTELQHQAMIAAIYGPSNRPGTPPAQPGVPTPPQAQPTPAPNSFVGSKRPLPAGKIRVQDKNGTFYFWDATKPVPQGFKVVRDK